MTRAENFTTQANSFWKKFRSFFLTEGSNVSELPPDPHDMARQVQKELILALRGEEKPSGWLQSTFAMIKLFLS